MRTSQNAVLGTVAGPHQFTDILFEERKGSVPTIVLGGFVPDATEAVYLLRGFLLRQGSVFYLNYPRQGFSAELFFAQLDDLVSEINIKHGQAPVVFAVSFGSGLAVEWIKRAKAAGRPHLLGGLLLVSPVVVAADLIDPNAPKATTLLGRAVKPYFDIIGTLQSAAVEKSRTIFLKMFEAGAQNKDALRFIMTKSEFIKVRNAVVATINGITAIGASERVQAMQRFSGLEPAAGVITRAPVAILFAEKEGAVLTENSPTVHAIQSSLRSYFPRGQCKTVRNPQGSPVQHASLIFHCFNFLSPIAVFYRQVKEELSRNAA